LEPLPASESRTITLAPWKQYIFAQKATYELRLPEAGSGAVARVEMGEPGMLVKLYRAFITKPFLNFLVLVASVLPNHNLGISIIILTLVVKLLLFLPTQRALEGQKKMQLLQPKLEVLKKEHSGDPQKLHEETVKIWKEHGVNPFQSCLPLLIQFPILIGLFHVIRDGVDLELSQHLLYESFRHLEWSFGTNFLGFDLTKAYPFVFPPILVVLQFVQMKLSFMIAGKKKKQAAQGKEESSEKKDEMQKAQDVQQKIMTYALPLMIGFFAWKLPSAVSLYWGISTLFAIGQQMIVNREHLKV
jgi:YidC/Oxa1 family membrane protein insertase